MNPFIDIDTPEKAYWAGYISLASHTLRDHLLVSSKDEGHLENLLALIPEGMINPFDVDVIGGTATYYTFGVSSPELVASVDEMKFPPGIVRKLARHYIRGMMDSRPVWAWEATQINLDLPSEMADYAFEYMPYLRAELLDNSRLRLYTCTRFDTYRALTYLYRDAPVAKPSRKRLYEELCTY